MRASPWDSATSEEDEQKQRRRRFRDDRRPRDRCQRHTEVRLPCREVGDDSPQRRLASLPAKEVAAVKVAVMVVVAADRFAELRQKHVAPPHICPRKIARGVAQKVDVSEAIC